MSDPKLFGKPGEFSGGSWHWLGPDSVAHCGQDISDEWYAFALVCRVQVRSAHRTYTTQAAALRALERELTRLAAGLDAMGVPRG